MAAPAVPDGLEQRLAVEAAGASHLRAQVLRFAGCLAAALVPLLAAHHWHPSWAELLAMLPGALWVAVEEDLKSVPLATAQRHAREADSAPLPPPPQY